MPFELVPHQTLLGNVGLHFRPVREEHACQILPVRLGCSMHSGRRIGIKLETDGAQRESLGSRRVGCLRAELVDRNVGLVERLARFLLVILDGVPDQTLLLQFGLYLSHVRGQARRCARAVGIHRNRASRSSADITIRAAVDDGLQGAPLGIELFHGQILVSVEVRFRACVFFPNALHRRKLLVQSNDLGGLVLDGLRQSGNCGL
mmetsp:Transcript_95963/g.271476  ORF Transcript_95963/g.271476 Transcript_95963/m.271476 type:complete len:205 (+) Transcript_95963:172-786(+)